MALARGGWSHPLASHAIMERREFVRRAALLAAAAGTTGIGASMLAGCGTDVGAPSSSTASTTLVPVHYGTAEPYWMQGNYQPVSVETDAFGLEVSGRLPAALNGLYVRNGSNPAGKASPHWFLGDGMVHGVRLANGKAEWYRNRYIDTSLYAAKVGFMGNGAPGGANNQSNVSVFEHGGRLLTSGEVGFPYEISPTDLSTVGVHDFDGALKTAMTAHPKLDPATGDMHFFGYGFVPPYLTYHVANPDGRLVSSQQVDVAGATMMHDFAITDRDVIFWDLPVVFDLEVAVAAIAPNTAKGGGGFPFKWKPSYGARIGIMPLGGPASQIRWVDIDPCYVFHGVNAYRDGDNVVMEVCRLHSMFAAAADHRPNAIHRWTIDTSGSDLRFSDEIISDQQMDLPAIDHRSVGRRHANAWYLDVETGPDGVGEFTGLTRRDTRSGALDRYHPGERYRMNEGSFVAADAKPDGDGWFMAYAWDRARDKSDLMVFDAHDLAAGPVAAIHLPVRVPYGFHGWWVPDQA